jgi:hypothetical protein
MNEKFLNKVLNQIVSETKIDYRERGKIFTPFLPHHYPSHFSFHFSSYRSNFTKHCEDVYGLNDDEANYVWGEYKRIINDKIK